MGLQQITGNEIAAGSIAATDLASASITGDKLGATSINANNIVGGTITTTQIASNTISNTNIATGAIEDYSRATGLLSGMRNRIINGAMVIDQRNAGSAVTADESYPVDRFQFRETTDGSASAQRSTTAPAGFANSLLFTVTSADSSLGANQYAGIRHAIEGFNVADLNWGTANAKTFTLSFWVRSSVTGTYGGVLRNSAATRNYPFSYTINSADTWEQKSITVAGDTTGTWLTTNGTGIELWLTVALASNIAGTAGSWSSSVVLGVTGQTNIMATNGATWYITGVQLEVGSTATSFDYRPYTTELQLCQRYYAKFNSLDGNTPCGAGLARSGQASNVFVKLPVTMRTNPTATFSNCLLNYNSDVYQTVNSTSGIQGGTSSVNYYVNSSTASMSTGYPVLLSISAGGGGGYVDFSAEL